MMPKRILQTTPQMVATAMVAQDALEPVQKNGIETWLIQDAASAHELLEIVRMMVKAHPQRLNEQDDVCLDAAEKWVDNPLI